MSSRPDLVPSMVDPGDGLTAAIRARLFQALLETGRPCRPESLGLPADVTPAMVGTVVARLVADGRITVADDGAVSGSLGLALTPTRHRIELAGRVRYTWCALDALGIVGAVTGTGIVESRTVDDASVRLTVAHGRLTEGADLAVVLPVDRGDVVVRTWCPRVNFAAGVERGRQWAATAGVPAEVVPAAEALALGTDRWRTAIAAAGLLGAWSPPAATARRQSSVTWSGA